MAAINTDFREQFFKEGYCVVPGVIPLDRVNSYVSRAYDWLESFNLGFKRDDTSTWVPSKLPKSTRGGLYHEFGIGHEQWVWDIRQEPGILNVFAKMWETDELLTSFDGVNISLPLDQKDPANSGIFKPWAHVDQSPNRQFFHCVQGIANLAENGPNDGGLMVLRGSNKYYNELFNEKFAHDKPAEGWTTVDSFQHTPEMLDWLVKEKGCEWHKVTAGPGDVILWDSRTVHYGAPPLSNNPRIATYVCYKPANLITPEQLEKKIEAFNKMLVVSHDPITFRVMNQLTKPDPAIPASLVRLTPDNPPVLSAVGRKLVGIEAY